MESKDQELSLEEQVARIREKRAKRHNFDKARSILNTVFLVLAAIGLVWYFCTDDHKLLALGIIGVGMILKVIEFVLRFLF